MKSKKETKKNAKDEESKDETEENSEEGGSEEENKTKDDVEAKKSAENGWGKRIIKKLWKPSKGWM